MMYFIYSEQTVDHWLSIENMHLSYSSALCFVQDSDI